MARENEIRKISFSWDCCLGMFMMGRNSKERLERKRKGKREEIGYKLLSGKRERGRGSVSYGCFMRVFVLGEVIKWRKGKRETGTR